VKYWGWVKVLRLIDPSMDICWFECKQKVLSGEKIYLKLNKKDIGYNEWNKNKKSERNNTIILK